MILFCLFIFFQKLLDLYCFPFVIVTVRQVLFNPCLIKVEKLTIIEILIGSNLLLYILLQQFPPPPSILQKVGYGLDFHQIGPSNWESKALSKFWENGHFKRLPQVWFEIGRGLPICHRGQSLVSKPHSSIQLYIKQSTYLYLYLTISTASDDQFLSKMYKKL